VTEKRTETNDTIPLSDRYKVIASSERAYIVRHRGQFITQSRLLAIFRP